MDIATETATLYTEREVAASRDLSCHACGETVPKHFKYWRVGILFDGNWDTVRRCQRCQSIHKHLRVLAMADVYSDEWPDDRLACGHGYREKHGQEPPAEVAALAFRLPGDEVDIVSADVEGKS